MDNSSPSIVQDLNLIGTVFSVLRDNEEKIADLSIFQFEDFILKELRKNNTKTKLIDQNEHLTLLDNTAAIMFISANHNVYDERKHMLDLLNKHNIKFGYVVNNALYPQINFARFIA